MVYSRLICPFDKLFKKKTNAENAFFCNHERCDRTEMILGKSSPTVARADIII